MPATFQRSFAGGIITQPNLNRKDTAKVASGVADAKNGWFLPGGGFQSRAGSRWITTTKDQADHVRIRRFYFNDAQAYALEIGEFYIRLYQISAQAYANATIVPPDPTIIALVDVYPDDAADDLAALSGTLPSAGVVSSSEGLLSLRLKATADGATTQAFGGGPGAKLGDHVYSSLSGFPGATIFWTDDTLTMRVKITSLTPSNGGTLDAGAGDYAFLLPRLHRTTAAGAGQERISAGGAALGDPTSCTVPGGGAGTLTGAGVDLIAGGLGTYIFTWSGTGHWGNSGAAIAATDRISAEVIATWSDNNGGVSVIAYEIESTNTRLQFPQLAPNQPGVPWNSGDQYVPGDIVFTGTGPLVYYYCVATHTGKNPDTVIYQNDFWYLLPNALSGDPILEIPTPFTAEDVPDVAASMVQSGDTISITHQNYPPHELIRHLDDIYSFGRWTCLPVGFKPRTTAPSALTIVDVGSAGAKSIRYKVTAIDRDTGAESAAGPYTAISTGTVSTASAQSTTDDLAVNDVLHALVTGDEIHIKTVATVSSDRANENAKIALEGTVWTVTRIDDDNFTIDGTAGLLTKPVISSIAEGYPQFTIDWGKAYVWFDNTKIPRAAGDGIEFSWSAVPNASTYLIYRLIIGFEKWGLLDSTPSLSYRDNGDEAGVKAIVDEGFTPPDYKAPFRYGLWPRASAYHAQRQWFGGTATEPLRAWGSVTGDFRNFSTRATSIASDAIDFTINSENANEIQSMAALGVLLIFTSGVIWTLPGNASGVISATDVPNLQAVSYEGASRVRPLIVGDSAMFFRAPGNSVLEELRFDFQGGGPGGYVGRPLTPYAPELFKGYEFVSLTRMSVPNSLVFAVRDDGAMLCLTHEQSQEVWAWSRMLTRPATDAIQDACSIPEDAADALYMIVRRSIDGTDVWYVERMDQRRLGEAGQDPRLASFFVDCGLTFDGTNDSAITLALTGGSGAWPAGQTGLTLTASAALFPGNGSNVGNGYRLQGAQLVSDEGELLQEYDEVEVIVTGDASTTVQTVTLLTAAPASTRATALLAWVAMVDEVSGIDHLEGEEVMAFADGHVLGPFTVAAGAIPAFARPYGIIHVGLPIDTSLKTLSIDTGDDGTVSAAMKCVKQATVWLNDSYRPRIAAEDGTAYPLPEEHGDDEGVLINGPRVARPEARPSRDGSIVISQSDPVPLCVTALMLEYELGEV